MSSLSFCERAISASALSLFDCECSFHACTCTLLRRVKRRRVEKLNSNLITNSMDVPSGWLEGISSIEYSAPQSRQMRVSLFNILVPLLRDITVEAMNVYYLSRYYRCASDETRGVFLSGKEEGRGNRGKGSSVSPFSGESCPRASERPGHKKRKRGGEAERSGGS